VQALLHNSKELSTIFVRLSTSYVSKTIIYYQSSFVQMPGDVDNLFVEIVSKFGITACYVENVDKLSTFFVDNSGMPLVLWVMWITCPQRLWITSA